FGFTDGPVFFGGEHGRILRYVGGAFEPMATPPESGKVFGIWGTSPTDLWAVGGTGIGDGFAWRYDGTAWRALTLPTELKNLSLFKVWGQRTDDVWLVGSLGAAGHWDG